MCVVPVVVRPERVLIVLPTYNERENLASIVSCILEALPAAHLWIIDDNSPDGTGDVANTLASASNRIQAFHRPGKLGLGTAYAESFERALENGYDYVVEMDADFSHDPAALPDLIAAAHDADLVLGSRYVPGGSAPDWSLTRRMISRTGNLVARTVLSFPIQDATTGYRVFSRRALAVLQLEGMGLKGYGFQIETAYQCYRAGLHICEHPIVFTDRRLGKSKMSRAIALEALIYVFRRRLGEFAGWIPGRRTGHSIITPKAYVEATRGGLGSTQDVTAAFEPVVDAG